MTLFYSKVCSPYHHFEHKFGYDSSQLQWWYMCNITVGACTQSLRCVVCYVE